MKREQLVNTFNGELKNLQDAICEFHGSTRNQVKSINYLQDRYNDLVSAFYDLYKIILYDEEGVI